MNERLIARRRPDAAGADGPGAGARLWAAVRRYWRPIAIAGAILVVAGIAFSVPVGPSGDTGMAQPKAPGASGSVTPTTSPVTPSPDPAVPASAAPAPEAPAAAPTPAPAPATESANQRPDPLIRDFARQPGVEPLPPQPSPTAGVELPYNINGCDLNYGTVKQCIPAQFPASVTDRCAWLARQGLVSIPVNGIDRHGLDVDGDRIACEPNETA
jgi:hypothetical protein